MGCAPCDTTVSHFVVATDGQADSAPVNDLTVEEQERTLLALVTGSQAADYGHAAVHRLHQRQEALRIAGITGR